jgi:membrane protein implicated in regulation of membrane protease activity
MVLLLTLLLYLLLDLPEPWAAALLATGCVLEVGELLVLRSWGRRLNRKRPPTTPDDELVGLVGEVVTPCRPDGQVRVRGELWAATCPAGADPGTRVRIEQVDELRVLVRPAARPLSAA